MRTAFAFLAALWLTLAAAFAYDPAIIGQAERTADTLRASLNQISQDIRNPAITEDQLSGQRLALEKIRASALDLSLKLVDPIREVNQQISSLGPAPTGDQTETPTVAKTRADLKASLDRLQGVKSQLDVIAVEAEQQSGRVGSLQREHFFERIFDRNRSILNPELWYDTGVGLGVFGSRLTALFKAWWSEVSPTANPLVLLLIPFFVAAFIGGYIFISRWLRRWTDSHPATHRPPDEIGRLWRIVRAQITTLVALAALIYPIRLGIEVGGYETARFMLVFNAVAATLAGTFLYYMFARRIVAPGQPTWRIVDLDDTAASQFAVLAGIAAFVAVGNAQLTNVAEGLYLAVNYSVGQSAFAALLMLVLLSLMLLTIRNSDGLPSSSGRQLYFSWASVFTPILWLVILLGFGALLFGYLALANFIAQKVFRTALLVTVLFLVHHLSDAAVAASFDPQSGFGRFLRRMTGLGERAIERLGLLFRTLVDVLLVIAGLPLLFLLWTVTWVDFTSLLNSAAMGIQIGEISISPGTIATALVVLACGIAITNLFNRWLDRRILAETRINRGVQESIRKGASYAGYFIAAAMAVTAAGLDFSSLAIVFGALGVGIGLGLQSITNNFVSGLILLAERPIRVGDWVALADGEGVVRKINVRSTEIETFDSCSIIVPNSTLITQQVRNWTHRDTIGRFSVAISIAQKHDPEQVQQLLLDIAREHPKVLTFPAPNVILRNISLTSFDYELRAYVADIFLGAATASDIRFTVARLFREKDIPLTPAPAVMQIAQQ